MYRRLVCRFVTVVWTGAICVPLARGLEPVSLNPDAGLKGEYFNDMSGWRGGAPVLTRIDPEINFDWGEGSPAPGVNADFFSVRWTGDVAVAVTDVYTFALETDDNVVFRIGDKAIIGEYWPQPANYEGTIALIGGRVYPIELIYSVGKDEAGVRLLWESSTQPREVVPARVLQLPVRARTPSPADGAVEVLQSPTLEWTSGCKAAHHDIYFGDDPNAVANATPATPGIYRGRQPLDATTFDASPLEWGKLYCWRVDEVNDAEPKSPWKGPIWSFTTADFLLIDDFESYTDDEGERIYETWIDGWTNGTGSSVGETFADFVPRRTPVHSGKQSMPFDYNDASPPFYSEAYRTWDVPQDWTVNGGTDLSLWVRGRPLAFLEKPNGNIVLTGAGARWDKWNEFRFVYRRLVGSGEITAKVESLDNTDGWAKAGVIIYEMPDPWWSYAAAARYAALVVTPANGLSFSHHRTKDGESQQTKVPGIQAPHWVRLARNADTFTAQHSADGITWQDVTDATGKPVAVSISMPETVYIGLCATSNKYGTPASAEFSHVALSGSVSEQWQVEAMNMADPSNSPDELYAALEDSGKRIAVAVNHDPGAVNVTAWTEWRIPLTHFTAAGVDCTSIKRMYLGVGDRNNPQPDGTGKIYIDDIRVIRVGPAE